MTLEAPEWLKKRGGELQRSGDKRTWFVIGNHQPLYALTPVPVAGKFGCTVTQTNNGRRLDGKDTCDSAEEAVKSGLEEVRKALGW